MDLIIFTTSRCSIAFEEWLMTVICTFVYGSVKEVSNICVLAMKVPITTNTCTYLCGKDCRCCY